MKRSHFLVLFFSILMPFSLFADTQINKSTVLIKPYSATYSTVWKKGISLKIEGTQALSKQGNNTWLLSFKADTFFASLRESSLFKLHNQYIQPIRYDYQTKAFGKTKKIALTFDWEKQQVVNNVKNKPWKMSVVPKTLDKLSVQLQIRQDIKNNKDMLIYQIADGGYLKQWEFKKVGQEKINSKIGTIDAIKVTRTDNQTSEKYTTFWFSPEHDYLLVKLEHRKKKEFYQLNIESVK